MRTYKILLNERVYTVSVEQTGKEVFKVIVDGEVFEGESSRRDNISHWLVRSANDEIRAQTRVLPADKVDVWLAGTPFQASVQVVGTGGYVIPTPGTGEQRISGNIRAPMPGRVTSILIREGESVDLGTPVLILEAMKMQNELASPIAGHVKSIHVQEGAPVKKDSLLIVVE